MLDFVMIAIGVGFFVASSPLRARLRKNVRRAMLLDYVLGSIVTIVIMVYLVYALINPERF